MGEIFTAAGQVAASAMQAAAIKEATQMQIDALERQRQYVYNNLNPSVVNDQALTADQLQAQNRLALQGQIDPALLNARRSASDSITKQLDALQNGGAGGDVMRTASQEAITGTPGMQEAKQKLVDAALSELSQGATLPPDVQAELVKAGLERGGMATGSASGQGTGGQILRTVLGRAGIELKAQRQKQAADLTTAAQNLESSRQNILQSLFPKLSAVQLSNLQGTQQVLNQADQLAPNAGLSGTQVANIWLARVGATNQLAQSAANAAAQGAMGQGQAWGNAIGGATSLAGAIAPSWGSVKGWLGSFGSGSGGADYSGYGATQPTGGSFGTGE